MLPLRVAPGASMKGQASWRLVGELHQGEGLSLSAWAGAVSTRGVHGSRLSPARPLFGETPESRLSFLCRREASSSCSPAPRHPGTCVLSSMSFCEVCTCVPTCVFMCVPVCTCVQGRLRLLHTPASWSHSPLPAASRALGMGGRDGEKPSDI